MQSSSVNFMTYQGKKCQQVKNLFRICGILGKQRKFMIINDYTL
jgi:hypothetical protein